ncbi:hydrolase/carboxylic esterase [Tistrella bauzanensis]|nr:hydrolase/carboxylic esterase [Tistrella bauzanensis]
MDDAMDLACFRSYRCGGGRVVLTGGVAAPIRFSGDTPAIEIEPGGAVFADQAYVQSFVPRVLRPDALPVVLIHGGALTGSMWETTPDDRPGWLTRFVQAGFAVHVVDAVERGRAGWAAIDGHWQGRPIMRSDQEAWSLYRLGHARGFAARKPFPGQRFPMAGFDALCRQHVPRWLSTGPQTLAALLAVIERTGPCILVGHSQGGWFAHAAAFAAPDLVRGCIAVEPAGMPQPPAGWRGDGRGGAGGGGRVQHRLVVLGDHLEATPFWSALAAATRHSVDHLRACGVAAQLLDLPAAGGHGNSHMPMMDDNSDDIAARLIDWIGAIAG